MVKSSVVIRIYYKTYKKFRSIFKPIKNERVIDYFERLSDSIEEFKI